MEVVDQNHSPGGILQNSVLKNFVKFTRQHLSQSLFFNKAIDY